MFHLLEPSQAAYPRSLNTFSSWSRITKSATGWDSRLSLGLSASLYPLLIVFAEILDTLIIHLFWPSLGLQLTFSLADHFFGPTGWIFWDPENILAFDLMDLTMLSQNLVFDLWEWSGCVF